MELLSILWNEIILNPMMNGLVVLYAILGHNFGIAIIVFTILVRIITLPLALRQIRSTKKMTELQPKLRALQQRYAKDRARLSQETMRLYKTSGVNPIGCLGPMIIQFPIWIGLYLSIIQVLPTNPETLAGLSGHLYSWLPLVHRAIPLQSRFLWLDLAVPDRVPIMAVLVGASMWITQKMTTPAVADPRQEMTNRMMLWMMPFMFAFFTLSLPSGLPLYWLVSNIVGIVIQYFATGWGGLFPARAPVAATVASGEAASPGAPLPLAQRDKETGDAGQNRDQRQDGGRSRRTRAKGARRRARGGRSRNP